MNNSEVPSAPRLPTIRRSFSSVGLLMCLSLGCIANRLLPPRMPPAREIPRVDKPSAPPEGSGQVAIDIADGPARISQTTVRTTIGYGSMSTPRGTVYGQIETTHFTTRELCISPCVVTLPFGTHNLNVNLLRDEHPENPLRPIDGGIDVNFGPHPSVHRSYLRRATPINATQWAGFFTAALSAAAAVTGGILTVATPRPMPGDSAEDLQRRGDTVHAVGWTMVAIGVPTSVLGFLLMWAGRGWRSDAASTEWTPEPGGAWEVR